MADVDAETGWPWSTSMSRPALAMADVDVETGSGHGRRRCVSRSDAAVERPKNEWKSELASVEAQRVKVP
jgi:hypothetical protein